MSAGIWITGARGFIGRHLARHLSARGASISGIGYGAWTAKAAAEWGISQWVNGEVSEPNLDRLVAITGAPRTVFHLAGGSSVALSLETPAEDYRRSVESTSNLLEWTRVHSPKTAVVLTSSAGVYGGGHLGPIPESTDPRPVSPYGVHKRVAELLCESYSRSFGVRTAVVRLFSVYGPELRKQLLWDLCERLSRGAAALELSGTGEERRDWLHISDATRILEATEGYADRGGFTVNGGTGHGVCVRELVHLVLGAWTSHARVTFSGKTRHGDPESLVADMTSAARLQVVTSMSLPDGVRNYVEWYRRFHGLMDS